MADTWVATIKTWAAAALASADMNAEIRDRAQVLANAVDGDSSGSTIKHRHKSGTLASRPAAGEAGRFYLATDLKELWADDGTNWRVLSRNARDVDYFLEEFWHDIAGYWTEVNTGGSWSAPDLAFSATRGQSGSASGNFATAYPNARTGASGGYIVAAGTVPTIFASRFIVNLNTQQRILIGLTGGSSFTTGDPSDGIYFRREDVGSATNVFLVCRAASTETTLDLGGDASAITDFTFQILGTASVKGFRGETEVGEITTNIPTTELSIAQGIATTEAVNKTVDIDMVELRARRL